MWGNRLDRVVIDAHVFVSVVECVEWYRVGLGLVPDVVLLFGEVEVFFYCL